MYLDTLNQLRLFTQKVYNNQRYQSREEYFKSKILIHRIVQVHKTLFPDLDTYLKLERNDTSFQPMNLEFLCSHKEVLKRFGTPIYQFLNNKIGDHKALFYKKVLRDARLNIQFHFLDDQLFYIHNELGFQTAKSSIEHNQMLKLMLERYHNNEIGALPTDKILLSDQNNNLIYSSNHVSFGINYLSGSLEIREKVKAKLEEEKKKKEDKESKVSELILAHI